MYIVCSEYKNSFFLFLTLYNYYLYKYNYTI